MLAGSVPSLWNPAKAVRLYVLDPASPKQVIDPAFPNNPLPASLTNILKYTIVPGSGDPRDGVAPFGTNGIGNNGILNPNFLLVFPSFTAWRRTFFRAICLQDMRKIKALRNRRRTLSVRDIDKIAAIRPTGFHRIWTVILKTAALDRRTIANRPAPAAQIFLPCRQGRFLQPARRTLRVFANVRGGRPE